MKSKNLLSMLVIVAFLLALVPISSVQAEAVKVPVCHFDKDANVFFLINISDNAYDTHINHGDVNPGDPIPGMVGMIYGSDCSPYRVFADVTGTWTGRSGIVDHLDYAFTMTLSETATGTITGTITYSGLSTAIRSVTGSVVGNVLTLTTSETSYSATLSGAASMTSIDLFGTDTMNQQVELKATK